MLSNSLIKGSLFALGILALGASAQEKDKNITHVITSSSADGKSEIRKEILEECYLSFPKEQDLQANVESNTGFLKGINGDDGKNAHMKTYMATIEINYILYQKELIIVTTSSVQGQEPVMKEVERKLKQTKSFISNPSEGDLYAGRSRRQYYFSTAEAAVKDVKKRATVWLHQQQGGVCPDR